ncbi:MAG: hypothetical protein CMQ16_03345 [Gammaproteobacteria bacterium]|nr:hypothetical protein [Gammaproteobacteria bacterium]
MKEHYTSWLSDAGYDEIFRVEALSGGCINNTARLQLGGGLSVILKCKVRVPAGISRGGGRTGSPHSTTSRQSASGSAGGC